MSCKAFSTTCVDLILTAFDWLDMTKTDSGKVKELLELVFHIE